MNKASMPARVIVRIIEFCTRHAWPVMACGLLLTLAAGIYAARNFAITSDVGTLLSPNLEWRKREIALEKAFNRFEQIVVVVQAPTPELTGQATAALAERLAQQKDRFRSVTQPGGGEFFARNGLLFQTPEALQRTVTFLTQAEPIIHDLATDQSLRGLVGGVEDALLGVRSGRVKLDDLTRVFTMASDVLDNAMQGRPASFSWRALAQADPAQPSGLRGIIEVGAVLDYGALEPGHAATAAIRQAAAEIAPAYQAHVRLTGPVPMADEEFGTLREGAVGNAVVTIAVVLFILWLALHSGRLIAAVFINLFIGLAITTMVGLMIVGAFNLISISFAVLFVGIGVDFGIQFSVRYRAERYAAGDLNTAIMDAGRRAGVPLMLAASATAAGFLSFLPTDYRGVSELGLIAGLGMLIAFATSITVLPALITLFNPPGEREPLGYSALAPVDEFLERHRIAIIAGTAIVVTAGLPLLYWLHFDFNPINLRSPKVESVATYLELSRDPAAHTNMANVLTPSLQEADAVADRVSKLSEVGSVMTLTTFIPDHQQEKLALIAGAAKALAGAFDVNNMESPPDDAANVEALNDGAAQLAEAAGNHPGPGADAARRLSAALTALAKSDQEARSRAEAAFLPSLRVALAGLQASLQPQLVTQDSLPPELRRDWMAPNGQARVAIVPKEDPNDNEAMRTFARAVLVAEPRAIDGPISVTEAGDTVVHSFIQAGLWALLSIGILLWIVLRRFGDVLLTLIPLLLAGVVTLEICVLIGMPLNFANIIALPLLLGVGVAFKIYYIMAWRSGQTNLLQTSLTRAVIFSALTTATAFGSLWFSSHPGTSSMGKLMALSLVCTMAAAVLFQPVLMGKPRETAPGGEA
jgi:hopanoid biosynthesis associated RND transporter like protein HpnN